MLLSLGGLAFKNGLYIFLLRQFFRGIPDELEESSYVDGYGVFKTFFHIILPLSVPMLITVFILSFSWQWTDIFYINSFMPSSENLFLTLYTRARGVQNAPRAKLCRSEYSERPVSVCPANGDAGKSDCSVTAPPGSGRRLL